MDDLRKNRKLFQVFQAQLHESRAGEANWVEIPSSSWLQRSSIWKNLTILSVFWALMGTRSKLIDMVYPLKKLINVVFAFPILFARTE